MKNMHGVCEWGGPAKDSNIQALAITPANSDCGDLGHFGPICSGVFWCGLAWLGLAPLGVCVLKWGRLPAPLSRASFASAPCESLPDQPIMRASCLQLSRGLEQLKPGALEGGLKKAKLGALEVLHNMHQNMDPASGRLFPVGQACFQHSMNLFRTHHASIAFAVCKWGRTPQPPRLSRASYPFKAHHASGVFCKWEGGGGAAFACFAHAEAGGRLMF